MTKILLCSVFAFSGIFLSVAAPKIVDGSVKMEQRPGHGDVVISYSLDDAPGIVTVDIQTNAGENAWTSIGGAAFVNAFSGDVGRCVDTGNRKIVWKPRVSWPDRVVAQGGIRAVLTAWATNAPPDWLAVNLTRQEDYWFCESEDMLPCGPVGTVASKTDWLVMKKVKAAGVRWVMGSNPLDKVLNKLDHKVDSMRTNETPHFVTLTEDYYMGVYEFTQAQFMAVGGAWSDASKYPSLTNLPLYPLVGSAWSTFRGSTAWPGAVDATKAERHTVKGTSPIGLLRARTGIDFDMPTEAQWEFACRAGSAAQLYNGLTAGAANVDPLAHTPENTSKSTLITYSDGKTTESSETLVQPVGGKQPNAWGFYDMLGNAHEFCLDYWDNFSSEEVVDPIGPAVSGSGTGRVRRGGGTGIGGADDCRCAYRSYTNQGAAYFHNGFRVMCPITLKW